MKNLFNGLIPTLGPTTKVSLKARMPWQLPDQKNSVLQWISVYWFSRAGPAATVRIYSEVGLDQGLFYHQWSSVPLGLSYFPKELLVVPKM